MSGGADLTINCGKCAHYRGRDDKGKCLRFPPVLTFHSMAVDRWAQPDVHRYDACGEFRKIQAVNAKSVKPVKPEKTALKRND